MQIQLFTSRKETKSMFKMREVNKECCLFVEFKLWKYFVCFYFMHHFANNLVHKLENNSYTRLTTIIYTILTTIPYTILTTILTPPRQPPLHDLNNFPVHHIDNHLTHHLWRSSLHLLNSHPYTTLSANKSYIYYWGWTWE